MADGITMQPIRGIDDLIRTLDTLPRKVQQRVVLKGLRAGAAQYKKALKRAAPVRTEGGPKRIGRRGSGIRLRGRGYLRKKGIITRKQRKRAAYQVGPQGAAYYARFTDAGTSRQRAQRWISPTWSRQQRTVAATITRAMRKAMATEVRKRG